MKTTNKNSELKWIQVSSAVGLRFTLAILVGFSPLSASVIQAQTTPRQQVNDVTGNAAQDPALSLVSTMARELIRSNLPVERMAGIRLLRFVVEAERDPSDRLARQRPGHYHHREFISRIEDRLQNPDPGHTAERRFRLLEVLLFQIGDAHLLRSKIGQDLFEDHRIVSWLAPNASDYGLGSRVRNRAAGTENQRLRHLTQSERSRAILLREFSQDSSRFSHSGVLRSLLDELHWMSGSVEQMGAERVAQYVRDTFSKAEPFFLQAFIDLPNESLNNVYSLTEALSSMAIERAEHNLRFPEYERILKLVAMGVMAAKTNGMPEFPERLNDPTWRNLDQILSLVSQHDPDPRVGMIRQAIAAETAAEARQLLLRNFPEVARVPSVAPKSCRSLFRPL